MTWFADLLPCTYFGEYAPPGLRAVGWLSAEQPFPVGPVHPSVIARLHALLTTPFSPWMFLGYHRCELCPHDQFRALPVKIRRDPFPEWQVDRPTTIFAGKCEGTQNLLVPGEQKIYVCPELILHYAGVHGYSPPEEFSAAVLRCPDNPSPRYFERLIEAGGERWPRFIRSARLR